jgi:fumarate reductase flavoprotein subunit
MSNDSDLFISGTSKIKDIQSAGKKGPKAGKIASPSVDQELTSIAVGHLRSGTSPPLRKRRDMVPERKFSFEIPPSPIPESAIKKSIGAEVVVIGAGLAGLSAAISAAEVGAKTILVEKMATVQARGHDNAFIDSRLQRKLGIEIDRDEVILRLMKYGANKPDQRLIRMWAEGSGQTADWLLNMTDATSLRVIIPQYPPLPAFNNSAEYYRNT